MFSLDSGATNYIDLAAVVGSNNLANITLVTGGSFDAATGLVKLDSPLPSSLTYTYNVHNFDNSPMDVTLSLKSVENLTPSNQPGQISAIPATADTSSPYFVLGVFLMVMSGCFMVIGIRLRRCES